MIQLTDPDYCEPDTPPNEGSKPDMTVRERGPLENRRNPKCAGDGDNKQHPIVWSEEHFETRPLYSRSLYIRPPRPPRSPKRAVLGGERFNAEVESLVTRTQGAKGGVAMR